MKNNSYFLSGGGGRRLCPDSAAGLIVAFLITFAFVNMVFPVGFLAGTADFWQTQVDDITQYIAGFNAYFIEPWHYPLFKIESLDYPSSTRTTFVDAIPIYALLLKIFVPDRAYPFNPFGFWVYFCFFMNAFSAWLLLRSLNLKSWIALTSLVVFLIISPSLLARLGHISLMSHWLILISIVLYVRSTSRPYQLAQWCIILALTFYINLYIFAMVYSIYIATYFSGWRARTPVQNLMQLALPTGFILASLFVTILPLGGSSVIPEGGWGLYSMNALAPFTGGKLVALSYTQVEGQGEGFNYLGLGVLLLFSYALYLNWKCKSGYFKRHIHVLFLMILFTVYSLSYRIYVGSAHVANIFYPSFLDPLLTQFRASGRFFWPVAYAIIIFSVVSVIRLGGRRGAVVLAVLLFVQIFDLSDRVRHFSAHVNSEGRKVLDTQALDEKLDVFTHIYYYPKFRCPTAISPHELLLPMMLYAATHEKNFNTGYIARNAASCDTTAHEIAASDASSSAYLFVKQDYEGLDVRDFFSPKDNINCEKYLSFIFCGSKDTAQ